MDMMYVEDCCEILDSMRVPITASDREEGEYPYYGANGIQDHVADYIFDDELVLLAEDGGNFGSKERPIAYRVSGKCWVNNHAHVLKPKAGLDVDYLCYSLMFYKVDGMINGATRQKLTQAAMRKMKIPFTILQPPFTTPLPSCTSATPTAPWLPMLWPASRDCRATMCASSPAPMSTARRSRIRQKRLAAPPRSMWITSCWARAVCWICGN